MHPADLSIEEAGGALRAGGLTCIALTQAHLDRIAERDPEIGAFVHVAAEGALDAAQRADAELAQGRDRGALHGIPFAIKDLLDVAGWPVRYGSSRYKTRIAETTAPAVQKLIDAGAIALGLVATYELGMVGPDPTGLYKQPRNPWNRDHVTGGSSSGSAASVAAGLVRIAMGTDTGGSVRSPSAYCGVCGFKPERGTVSADGLRMLAPSLDMIGAIGRSVPDTFAMVEALSDGLIERTTGLNGLKIGYARNWAADDPAAHPLLLPTLDEAASTLSLLGAEIAVIDLPDYAPIEAVAARILMAEQAEMHRDSIADGGRDLGRMAYESLLWGTRLTKRQIADARASATGIRREVEGMLAAYDAVILPTALAPALPFAAFVDGKAVWTAMRTIPFNLTGHAALSVPMGFADGLPLGLQIVGAFGRTATVLRVGAAFEAATDHSAIGPYPT